MRVSDILLDLSHVRLKMANIRFQPHDATVIAHDRLSLQLACSFDFPCPRTSRETVHCRRIGAAVLTDCGPPAGPLRGREGCHGLGHV